MEAIHHSHSFLLSDGARVYSPAKLAESLSAPGVLGCLGKPLSGLGDPRCSRVKCLLNALTHVEGLAVEFPQNSPEAKVTGVASSGRRL